MKTYRDDIIELRKIRAEIIALYHAAFRLLLDDIRREYWSILGRNAYVWGDLDLTYGTEETGLCYLYKKFWSYLR